MAVRTSGILGTVRRMAALVAGSAMLLTLAGLPAPGTASADAGNPILATIHGSIQPNADGTVTVFVRGEWNWLSHNSDCNFDRAATGVGMIWNDPTEPGFTVIKGTISAGVGVTALRGATPSAGENPKAYPDTSNTVDQMVHPVDRGTQVEGSPSGPFKSTTAGYSSNAAGDFPFGQVFSDPATPGPTTANVMQWRGGCGRELLTATASNSTPSGEATATTCANGTTTCSGHPWGSWGYEKVTGMARGYSHTYAQRRDISQVCVNFYDVHGGGKANSSSFQVPGGTKEIDVNGNGDNSIQTNAFNTNQGANCVNFPFIDHTTAVTNVLVGSKIHDQAFIGGAAAAQVTYLQFHLFAPSDPTCAGADLYSGGRIAVTGSGTATSDDVVATPAGDFHWTAELFDAATGGALLDSTKCGDTGETSHVNPKQPTIATTASGPVTIGKAIHDPAQLAGLVSGVAPTGTITFTAYAPTANGSADVACGSAVFTDIEAVDSTGKATSGSFTPSGTAPQIAGTYEWKASYSGDANYKPVGSKCDDAGEQSLVNKKQPAITTTASGPVTIGDAIHDVAQLTMLVSGVAPTGTITFTAYAPTANGSADVACGTALFTDTEPVDSTGKATSGSFTPSGTAPQIAGTYEWIASYSGDSNYKGTTSSCNDTGEQSLVKKKDTTTPTGQKVLISDFAKPTGFGTPTGTVTFSLFDNAGCTGTPIFTQTTSLVNGLAHADDPTPLNANGTYKWVVTYNGDANNSPSTSACGTEFTTLGGNTPGVDP